MKEAEVRAKPRSVGKILKSDASDGQPLLE
jgi:hypothetical protein